MLLFQDIIIYEMQSVRINSSKNSLSQGTSNNILPYPLITFQMNRTLPIERNLEYYLGKVAQIFFSNLYIGKNKHFGGNTTGFFITYWSLFSNILKLIKLAHLSALDSGPV